MTAGLRVRLVSMPPRRIVVCYATATLVGGLLAAIGLMRLPSRGYLASDFVLEALLIVGLWFLWRPAWIVAFWLTLLGGALLAIHPVAHLVLLLVGSVQLALLLLPQAKQQRRGRPDRTIDGLQPGDRR